MHWTIAGIAIGMREVVVGLVLLLAVYIVFLLLRMRGIGQSAEAAPEPEPRPPVETPAPSLEALLAEPPEPRYTPPPQPAPSPVNMAERAMHASLERELLQLREEVDAMRGELAALREDMTRELAHVRAGQTVAPIYGDAMQMAVAGYDAAMIAERCGIARAEAELVVALAKSQG